MHRIAHHRSQPLLRSFAAACKSRHVAPSVSQVPASPAQQPSLPRRWASTRLTPSNHKPAATGQPNNYNLTFSQDAVPPLSFWTAGTAQLGADGPGPTELWEAAKSYCLVATTRDSAWKRKLRKGHGISNYLLHYMGVLLVNGPASSRWTLGLNMLETASELGYAPSTLSLVRIGMRGTAASAKAQRFFAGPRERFDALLRQAPDANALTLQGLLVAATGSPRADEQALAWLDRAVSQGGGGGDTPRPGGQKAAAASAGAAGDARAERPAWDWAVACFLERGRLLLKRGRRGEAVAAYRTAALALDSAEAYYQLSRLVDPGSPEREQYLVQAAVSGVPEACRALGHVMAEKADKPSQASDTASVKDMRFMAGEWLQLGGADNSSSSARAAA